MDNKSECVPLLSTSKVKITGPTLDLKKLRTHIQINQSSDENQAPNQSMSNEDPSKSN